MDSENYIILGGIAFTMLFIGWAMNAAGASYSSGYPLYGVAAILTTIGILMFIALVLIAIFSHMRNREYNIPRNNYNDYRYRNESNVNNYDDQPPGSFSKDTGRFRRD